MNMPSGEDSIQVALNAQLVQRSFLNLTLRGQKSSEQLKVYYEQSQMLQIQFHQTEKIQLVCSGLQLIVYPSLSIRRALVCVRNHIRLNIINRILTHSVSILDRRDISTWFGRLQVGLPIDRLIPSEILKESLSVRLFLSGFRIVISL